MTADAVSLAIEQIYLNDRTRILATLIRQTRDIDAAEDAFQEAVARAVASWQSSEIPAIPAAWVTTAAKRIAIDTGRRMTSFRGKMPELMVDNEAEPSTHDIDLAFGDDRLRLIFTCCHPVLTPESRIALTLRMICGLSTPDIASLFLVQESTMAARITRVKKKLSASGVPYQIPSPNELDDRLNDVLSVVYLVATSAHTPGTGDGLHNTTHMRLALDLTRVLEELIPQHPEVMSLRALALLAEARKDSRLDTAGNALPLEHMDRSLWNTELISEAQHLTEESLRLSRPDSVGKYTLQAAIAMVHTEAKTYEDTDWAQIVALYTILDHHHPSAVVRLGYAIAMGMHQSPQYALKLIDESGLDEALPDYPMLPAARAFLLRRSGNIAEAMAQYERATQLTSNGTLAAWFRDQIEELNLA